MAEAVQLTSKHRLLHVPTGFTAERFSASIPFTSTCCRAAIAELIGDTPEVLRFNDSFPVNLYIPADYFSAGQQHLLIMFNGFAQGASDLDLFFNIGEGDCSISAMLEAQAAARRNRTGQHHAIAVAMLPLPFHFDRYPGQGQYVEKPITHYVFHYPERFIQGAQQAFCDACRFIDQLAGSHESVWSKLFASARLHIGGYSAGGYVALAAFLAGRMRGAGTGCARRVETCHLIASGAPLPFLIPGSQLPVVTEDHRSFIRLLFRRELKLESRAEENSHRLPKGNLIEFLVDMQVRKFQRLGGQFASDPSGILNDSCRYSREFTGLFQTIIQQDHGANTDIAGVWHSSREAVHYYLCDGDDVMTERAILNTPNEVVAPANIHHLTGIHFRFWKRRPWKAGDGDAQKVAAWMLDAMS